MLVPPALFLVPLAMVRPPAHDALEEAWRRSFLSTRPVEEDPRETHLERIERFEAALEELGGSLAGGDARPLAERLELAADDPDRASKLCLAEIALDRRARPELHRAFLAHYLESGDPRRHVQLAGALLEEHLTPEHRWAFARLLVAPVPSAAVGYEERAASGLGSLGDPQSLELLGLAFRSTCRPGTRIDAVASRQTWILAALALRAEPERLELVLDCLERAAEQFQNETPRAHYDVVALFESDWALLAQAGASQAAAWRELVARPAPEVWTPARRALRDRLAAALVPPR
jgi:hypothetical protein